MRVGDFGVEIVPVQGGEFRELESGHVLARAGVVYAIRLRNHGPLRAVAEIRIDGKPVTSTGIVLNAWSVAELQRPMEEGEHGRFTVIAEGDERVFGPDGGRDNPNLGVIEVRFRRELPRDLDGDARPLPDVLGLPHRTRLGREPLELNEPMPQSPGRPMAPPGWNPADAGRINRRRPDISAIASPRSVPPSRPTEHEGDGYAADPIERAAGTGLTGHSSQRFISVYVGPLEQEATVIRLRIVIGSEEAFLAPRPLPDASETPARPAARP